MDLLLSDLLPCGTGREMVMERLRSMSLKKKHFTKRIIRQWRRMNCINKILKMSDPSAAKLPTQGCGCVSQAVNSFPRVREPVSHVMSIIRPRGSQLSNQNETYLPFFTSSLMNIAPWLWSFCSFLQSKN